MAHHHSAHFRAAFARFRAASEVAQVFESKNRLDVSSFVSFLPYTSGKMCVLATRYPYPALAYPLL